MHKHSENRLRHDRRAFLRVAGAGAVTLISAAWFAKRGYATPEETASRIQSLVGSGKPMEGPIEITLPEIAENGNTVPISVSVDSPMSPQNYVKAIHIFAERNPAPDVATFNLTPECGKAEIAARMRLGETQNVVVVAQTSGGATYIGKKEIKVTIGGCGG